MTVELIVPTLGESITEATVSKWLKKVGEPFDIDEPLVEIETDKITVEVPALLEILMVQKKLKLMKQKISNQKKKKSLNKI